jgi:hypothetical protein
VWEGFVARLQVAKAPTAAPERERATDGAYIHTPLCRASRPSRPPPLACPPARLPARPPLQTCGTHTSTHAHTHAHPCIHIHARTQRTRSHDIYTQSLTCMYAHIPPNPPHTHALRRLTRVAASWESARARADRVAMLRRLHRPVRGSKENPKHWDTFWLFQQPCGSRQQPIMLAVPPIWWHARQRTFRCQNEVPRQGRKILYRRESTLHRCPLVVPLGSNSMPCCISSGTFQLPPVVVLQYVYENAWPPT